MADFVNKVKTKDNKEYAINDKRIPEITLGDTEKVLGVNENGNYDFIVATGTDNLKNLLNGEITEISYEKAIDHIPAYLANNVPSLTNISLNSIKNGIGSYAFMNSEYITSIDLGKVNGEIGDHAFAGLVNVNHFSIDSDSEITDLGHSAFAGIGMDRNSAERFVFDFRNSSFTDFEGFGTPSIPASINTSTGEVYREEILGIGLTNADIYLPETVESFMKYGAEGEGSSYGYSSGSDNGVLHNCTNIDLYITGKDKVIPLKDLDTLPTDDESHIFVPNEIFGKYAIATNWVAYENLIDYIDNSVDQAILPLYDVEGYELSWYKDKALTDPTTLGTGNTVYAIKTGERLMSKVVLGEAYKGSIEIIANESTYEPDQLIPVGTEITITPVSNEPGEPVLSLFKVNGEVYDGAVTLTLAEDTIIADVYYNIPEVPDYLMLVGPYGSQSDNLRAIKWNYDFSGEVPSNIDISPYYIKNNRVCIVKDCYSFRDTLQDKDYYVTLPDTIEEIKYSCFSYCTGLKSINIPSSITAISSQTFYQCSNLEDIGILPKSVNYVDTQGFGACPKLTSKNIYYEGKPGDIFIYIPGSSPDSTSNKPFKDALLYYAEELPEDLQGSRWWHYVNGEPTEWPVEHHYSEEWSYDEEKHWHQCIDKGFEWLKKDEEEHNFEFIEETEPTENEDGYAIYRCSVCGFEKTVMIPALNNFEFTLLDDGTYAVKGNNNSLSGDIYLPSKYQSLNITKVAGRGFYQYSNITSLIIPEGFTTIEEGAFTNCMRLTDIELPKSLSIIKDSAFYGCPISSVALSENIQYVDSRAFNKGALYNLEVDINNPIYDSRDNCNAVVETATNKLVCGCQNTIIPDSITSIGYQAFYGCSNLTSITIPNSVTSIGDFAFENCFNLTPITIPNSVTSIGFNAFFSCYLLTSIIIPDSVISIGFNAFSHCSNLTSIEVDPNNPKYDSRESCNAIIETDTNKLVCGCLNTIIPNSVTSIGVNAFSHCSNLTSIAIPSSVTTIGSEAFFDCSDLVSITIPDSVISIGFNAFSHCSNLTEFNYSGVVAKWENIDLAQEWKAYAPFTVIHCTDGDIQL